MKTLTEDQRIKWATDGYIQLEGALSPDEVAFFSNKLDEVRKLPGFESQPNELQRGHYKSLDHADDLDPEGFMDRRDLLPYGQEFIDLIDHQPVFDLIVDLMGPYIAFSMSQAIVRPANDGFPGYTHTDGGEGQREVRVMESSRPIAVKALYLLTDVEGRDVLAHARFGRVGPVGGAAGLQVAQARKQPVVDKHHQPVASEPLGVGGPVAPAQPRRNGRGVGRVKGLLVFLLLVEYLQKQQPHELGNTLGVAIHPGNARLATCGVRHVRFWEVSGRRLRSRRGLFGDKGNVQPVLCAAFPGGDALVTGQSDGSVYRWAPGADGAPTVAQARTEHEGPVSALFVLLGTAGFATGGKDGKVVLWEAGLQPTATIDVCTLKPAPLNPSVRSVCIADGKLLVGTKGGDSWAAAIRDAEKHRSVNAGWLEATMGGALGLALAGPRQYGHTVIEDAWMNDGGRVEATSPDIHRALSLYRKASAGLAAMLLLTMALV